MTDKNAPLKKETISNDITLLVDKKIGFFKDVIQKTIIHVQKNKFLDILGIGDVGTCIDRLGDLNRKIHDVANNKNNIFDIQQTHLHRIFNIDDFIY